MAIPVSDCNIHVLLGIWDLSRECTASAPGCCPSKIACSHNESNLELSMLSHTAVAEFSFHVAAICLGV